MVESRAAGAAEASQALTSGDDGPGGANEQSIELEDAIAHLEVAHMSLRREGAIYARQSAEMLDHSKVLDEQIEQLRDRFTAVSSELGQQQMTTSTAAEADASAGGDQNELVSYDSVASTINAACKKALRSRLQDGKFVDELLSRRGGAEVVHCRVVYAEEAIDWKVYDDADGTEATVGALLQDVARYWGLRAADLVLQGRDGAIWSLEGYVHDEMRQAGTKEVLLVKRPVAEADEGVLDIEYIEDERLLPASERRKRDRARRERLNDGRDLRVPEGAAVARLPDARALHVDRAV